MRDEAIRARLEGALRQNLTHKEWRAVTSRLEQQPCAPAIGVHRPWCICKESK